MSSIPFLADNVIETNMKDSYSYHLTYPADGRQTHYYVERINTNIAGKIDLVYTTNTNTLNVKPNNIDVLHVYCRSMYEDECKEVYGFDPSDNSNYYKWYFIEKNHFIVNIESDNVIKELSFIDMPVPYQVYVNGLKWIEGRQYNYTNAYSVVLSKVPKGNTRVDIYFKTTDMYRPLAKFKTDKTIANINSIIYFDANESFDIDGEIISYIWDFGDGNNSGGKVNHHSYSEPGIYGVILTVRDNDFLIDTEYRNITIIKGTNRPVINGIVPNQIKDEDSAPWELDLTEYIIDLDSVPSELRWYLTGENTSLYQVVGENSTDQKLIFSPMLNAFGNNLVTLWLVDKDEYQANQTLWINITPINDKPVINQLPNLVVRYDVPYRFSLSNYIYDVETPKDKLIVSAQDKFGNKYISMGGQEIEFRYPKELLHEIILTTVMVSDGQDRSNAIITVTVSDNWPPIILNNLPDVVLEEKSTKLDVFKLDDYFFDPEGEDLYFGYSESNVVIYIKTNNSVDIIARGDWTGEEEVMFQARDSQGSIVQDTIKITVVPINDPPVIGEVPDLMVHFDLDYYFDLSYYIYDSDNELEDLILTYTDKDHIRTSNINNLGIILKYPKSMLGITTDVVITVSDGQLSVTKTISVTVIPEYPPELIKHLPDISFNEDENFISAFDLDDHFLDLDNDTLYYTTGHVMVEISIESNHKVNFYAPENWYGTESVTFRATDPIGALVEDLIIVTVLPVNDPPVLSSLPRVTINETETVEIDLRDYIYDVDTNISNIIIQVEHEDVFVSGTSLVLFGSKGLTKNLNVVVSDGELSDSAILEIDLITKPTPENANISEVISTFILIIIVIILIITLVLVYLYKRMQKYDIDEIFLIHNSGKLITHVCTESHSKFDNDIFSGMFTAIQGFIEESFTSISGPISGETLDNEPETKVMKLNEFKVGENQVLIEHGQFIFMAVVYIGPGSQALHRKIKESINDIETKYSKALEYWIGDMKDLKGLAEMLIPLISGKIEEDEDPFEKVKAHKITRVPVKLKPVKRTKNRHE
jgi:PKD repeat protein